MHLKRNKKIQFITFFVATPFLHTYPPLFLPPLLLSLILSPFPSLLPFPPPFSCVFRSKIFLSSKSVDKINFYRFEYLMYRREMGAECV